MIIPIVFLFYNLTTFEKILAYHKFFNPHFQVKTFPNRFCSNAKQIFKLYVENQRTTYN